MSRIFPASGKQVQWSPDLDNDELKKQASVDDGIVEVEVSEPDPLLDAVKGLSAIDVSDEVVVEDGEAADVVEDVVEEVANEVTDDTAEDVTEDAAVGEAKAKIDEATEALSEAGEALDAIEEVHSDENVEDAVSEIEIEIDPEECAEECPIEDKSEEGELEKEGDDTCACTSDKADEKEIEIDASVDEVEIEIDDDNEAVEKEASYDFGRLIHIAKTSPQNRKDLVNYWEKMLGFPSEYVKAMVKNYD